MNKPLHLLLLMSCVALMAAGCAYLDGRKVPPRSEEFGKKNRHGASGVPYYLARPKFTFSTPEGGGRPTVVITAEPDKDQRYEVTLREGLFSTDSFAIELSEKGELVSLDATTDDQTDDVIVGAVNLILQVAKTAASIGFLSESPGIANSIKPVQENTPEIGAKLEEGLRMIAEMRGQKERLAESAKQAIDSKDPAEIHDQIERAAQADDELDALYGGFLKTLAESASKADELLSTDDARKVHGAEAMRVIEGVGALAAREYVDSKLLLLAIRTLDPNRTSGMGAGFADDLSPLDPGDKRRVEALIAKLSSGATLTEEEQGELQKIRGAFVKSRSILHLNDATTTISLEDAASLEAHVNAIKAVKALDSLIAKAAPADPNKAISGWFELRGKLIREILGGVLDNQADAPVLKAAVDEYEKGLELLAEALPGDNGVLHASKAELEKLAMAPADFKDGTSEEKANAYASYVKQLDNVQASIRALVPVQDKPEKQKAKELKEIKSFKLMKLPATVAEEERLRLWAESWITFGDFEGVVYYAALDQ